MTNFTYNPDDFEMVREMAEAFYIEIGQIPCPYFEGNPIVFNTKGIHHLKFRTDKYARPQKDQYSRLKLLYLAPQVIKLSRTVQGVSYVRQFENQKSHSRWEKALKEVTYYEFIAVLENVRVKVIVKRVANDDPYFWSIIPYWKIDTGRHRRILHTGNPEQD